MTVSKRAIKYVTRQRGKSALLGSIFFFSLFISLTGIIILRVTTDMMASIAANSNAHISVSATEPFVNEVPAKIVDELSQLENIAFINRQNRYDAAFQDELNGIPDGPKFGVEFAFTGMDHYELDGPFFHQQRRLVAGTFDLSEHQVLVAESLAIVNGWEIGTKLDFKNESGSVIEVEVAGFYETIDLSERVGDLHMYGAPELIHALQEDTLYSFVQFYVEVPSQISETEEKIYELVLEDGFFVNVSDFLFQRMNAPMESLKGLIEIMLIITIATSAIVISLLLSLWMRERRKETGLLLSIGEPKTLIMAQRLLETFIIFWTASVGVLIINTLFISNLGRFLFQMHELPNLGNTPPQVPDVYLTLTDFLQTFGIGHLVIGLAIVVSTLPLIKSQPKNILSSID